MTLRLQFLIATTKRREHIPFSMPMRNSCTSAGVPEHWVMEKQDWNKTNTQRMNARNEEWKWKKVQWARHGKGSLDGPTAVARLLQWCQHQKRKWSDGVVPVPCVVLCLVSCGVVCVVCRICRAPRVPCVPCVPCVRVCRTHLHAA